MAFNIPEELHKLPKLPGVYLMHNKRDEIIYVGKAISLRNRVSQYFQTSYKKSAKIEQMVSHIAYFEYIVTDSELEALVLENNLIKEHRPRYNTMLRDDKTYPYIKMTTNESYPRLKLVRRMSKDKCRYYGPFSSAGAVRDTIELLNKSCGLRDCETFPERPCLNYHIGICPAPCAGIISRDEYMKGVEKALDFLDGNFDPTIEALKEKMEHAAAELDYEKAATYRDMLNSVLHVAQRQKITSTDEADRDIIALAKDDRDAIVQIFFIRDGKMVGREHHYLNVSIDDSRGKILESFIKQFYGATPMLPREILLQYDLEDNEAELLSEWLSTRRGSRVKITTPKKGRKEKLIELAYKNASLTLEKDREKIKRDVAKSTGAVHEIEKLIGIDEGEVKRIEAYDISNTSGIDSVGSMIVFEGGKPKKNDYRIFKIKTVEGPNDYASLAEVLERRFTHELRAAEAAANVMSDAATQATTGDTSFSQLPDLILMDGGRGQVNVCLELLGKLIERFRQEGEDELAEGLGSIKVAGMVKDDNHNTRGLIYNNIETDIDTHSEGFKLITRIQDEAHRFAIEFHRARRLGAQVHSVLDDIPGIGPTRRKALMRNFKTIDAIKAASEEELAKVDGMNASCAHRVYRFFREGDRKA